MKILFLAHQFFPEYQAGTEKFIFNIALMAQKLGNKVKVLTYSFLDDSQFDQEFEGILYRNYLYKSIPVIAFKHKVTNANFYLELENLRLSNFAKKILEDEAPDIIHGGHLMRVPDFVREAGKLDIPYVLTLTDSFLLCPKIILMPTKTTVCYGPQNGKACTTLCRDFSKEHYLKRLNQAKAIIKNARRVIVPSKFMAGIINQEIPDLKIDIINHGMKFSQIKPNTKTYNSSSNLVFGFCGTLVDHKGVHVLIKAFSEIENNQIRLVIYGTGPKDYVEHLKKLARDDRRITFAGTYSPDNISDPFNKIDVLVIPSICHESYTFVMVEAFAHYVPVIASKLGALPDKISDGNNGLIFEPGSTDDLKKKMEALIQNPELLNQFKENIRANVTISTQEQESYRYYKIYNSIMFGPKKGT